MDAWADEFHRAEHGDAWMETPQTGMVQIIGDGRSRASIVTDGREP